MYCRAAAADTRNQLDADFQVSQVGQPLACHPHDVELPNASLRLRRELHQQRSHIHSAFLSGAEAGTVALTAGDWEEARRQFARAVAETEDLDDRALLGASNLAEGLGSFVLNDTTQAYRGEGFGRPFALTGDYTFGDLFELLRLEVA